MDLTNEYQNMLEAAQEIQELWKWQIGDYYYSTILKETHVAKGNNLLGMWDIEHENGIWLPRQDQLEELTGEGWDNFNPRKYAYEFWNWIAKTSPKHNSTEQMKLEFLMATRFHKTWNGNEWIKQ